MKLSFMNNANPTLFYKQDVMCHFIIPHFDEYIIYSPRRGGAFVANNSAKFIIEKYINNQELSEEEKKTKVFDYIQHLEKIDLFDLKTNNSIGMSRLIILLTHMCNLSCTYCYSQKCRSTDIIGKDKLQTVIDYVFSNDNISRNTLHFSFGGGGEPFTSWDLFVWTIEYIESKAKKKSTDTKIQVVTNATILDDTIANFLREHNIKLTISFDILPEVQNKQRSFTNKQFNSFYIVNKNIINYMAYGIFGGIRSTITDMNVDLMLEMASFVRNNYPKINTLIFEPVSNNFAVNQSFYEKYVDQYFIAKDYCQKNGISLSNSIEHSFFRIRDRFCPMEFCITPTGDIVSCHRISSTNDVNYNFYHIGTVENNINISKEQIQKVLQLTNKKNKKCDDCFAKWHCAGGCPVNRNLFSEIQQEDYCSFVKIFTKNILVEKLKKAES